MARRGRKKGKRGKKPRPSALGWGAAAALALPGARILMGPGTFSDKLNTIQIIYTGTGQGIQGFEFDRLTKMYGAPLALIMMKKGLSKFGVRMPNGVPFNF